MKKYFKRLIYILIILISFLLLFPFKCSQAKNELTQEQKGVKAVINAYYRKGNNLQYGPPKRNYSTSPEQATSQNTVYFQCTSFIFSIYYQAFNIEIIPDCREIMSYANQYYDSNKTKTNDITEFWIKKGAGKYVNNKGQAKKMDFSTANGRYEYGLNLIKSGKLREGDIICGVALDDTDKAYNHVLIVYRIVYDNKGNPIDAVLRDSSFSKVDESNKLAAEKYGVYESINNETTKVTEGSIKENYLLRKYTYSSGHARQSIMERYIKNLSYFAIYRPVLLDKNGKSTGKYYKTSFVKDDSKYGKKCTSRVLTSLSNNNDTLMRLKYSEIDIEKTVDQSNYKTVDLNTSLEYTIKVTNTSRATYKNFDIIENISEYVRVEDKGGGTQNGSKLTWTIKNLAGGQSKEIKYKVKVKGDENLYGKTITSTGTVAGIKSATITNYIAKKLSNDDIKKIKEKSQDCFKRNGLKGSQLINTIYKETLGIDLNLDKLKLNELLKESNSIIYYSPITSKGDSIKLNTSNQYYGMVLKKYYGGLYNNKSRRWENYDPILNCRSERADTIYYKNFMTGDILVYKNSTNPKTDYPAKKYSYPTENGTFYLIYISKSNKIKVNGQELYGFIGITSNGSLKKINVYTDSEARQILAKDEYVILRPAQSIDIEEDLLNVDSDEEELVGTVYEDAEGLEVDDEPTDETEEVSMEQTRTAQKASQQAQDNTNNDNTQETEETAKENNTDGSNTEEVTNNDNNSSNGDNSSNGNNSPKEQSGSQTNGTPESYNMVIESDVGMKKIMLYKKTTNNKYILFKVIMPEGAKKYTVKILKSLLNSSGKTEFKAVVTEIDGNREVVNASIPR